ncbi:MAG: hypothetical protein K2Q22_07420, partial [Cytophagales bacterium]|nr:hypothetical protein [Cytophagales bacterium]
YPTTSDQQTNIQNASVLILNELVIDIPLLSLSKTHELKTIFTRIKSDDTVSMATKDSVLKKNDIVSIVGTAEELEKAILLMGEKSNIKLDDDRSEIEYRRVLVSNSNIVGYTLGELNLEQTLGVIPTRIRRGDVDFLPDQYTVLKSGDRIRIVSEKSKIEKASAYLGDSFKALSEIDIFTFSIGIALGLLLGTLPLVFAQNFSIKMGLAGGPLVVALILGYLGRTGPLVWTMPYNTNLTLRQIGITLFLAGVGTRSGYAFKDTIMNQPIGIWLFLIGIGLTTLAAFTYLFIGYQYLKIPFAKLLGMLAGFQTQPAVLGFANELTKHEKTNEGYAAVFPIATIAKIVLAQVLLILL